MADQDGALMQLLTALAGFRQPEETQTVLWNLLAAGHLNEDSSSESDEESESEAMSLLSFGFFI